MLEQNTTFSEEVFPIGYNLLVRLIEAPEETASGLILPETARTGEYLSGIIEKVGPLVPPDEFYTGQLVFFLSTYKENQLSVCEIQDQHRIVPFQAVVASKNPELSKNDISEFFQVPPWEDFEKGERPETWERYGNIKSFVVRVHFLEPFSELNSLSKRIFDSTVETLRGVDQLDMWSIQYKSEENGGQTLINDDLWAASYSVSQQLDGVNPAITFQQVDCNLKSICKTTPRLLTALFKALKSPEFIKIAGKDYSRVTAVTFRIAQQLRLEGKTSKMNKVKNSEAMQKFLLFGQKGKDHALDALALSSNEINRIDMTTSFQQEIADHEYRIFLEIEAPANDDHSRLDVRWDIQDHAPVKISEQKYGPVFSQFFRDTVLRAFYTRWFESDLDIVCSTNRG